MKTEIYGNKMSKISLRAYAKINLSLDVLKKLSNGYHQVKMVMQQVDLWDQVTVTCRELPPGETTVIGGNTSRSDLPMDETNIAYRAAKLMKETYRPQSEYEIGIALEKNIPMAAGLAGGSADGAAVMRALARLWELEAAPEELAALSTQLGSDVPFCLMGQEGQFCALAEGTGTLLTPVTPLRAWILLSKPSVSVPTKQVYEHLKLAQADHPDVEQVIRGLSTHHWPLVRNNMKNVLEPPAMELYPAIRQTKEVMEAQRLADAVLMSGSGPTVFGVYLNRKKAQRAYHKMKQLHPETFFIRTLI